MKTREEILASLGAAKAELQERFRVRTLALFGSYARNQQTERSDVDILVEVDPSIGLGFVSLAEAGKADDIVRAMLSGNAPAKGLSRQPDYDRANP